MKQITEVEKRYAILALSGFVQTFIEAGVKDAKTFNDWKKQNNEYMQIIFNYPSDHGLPAITGLVKPFFHDTLPLVGLNYTPLAHNTLHEFPQGWTTALRLCRGIVFDHNGDLIALPFIKFFNLGENPETTNLPPEPFEATAKQDGHLGIIFRYHDEFIITTRGSFYSPTIKFARRMLSSYVKKHNWDNTLKSGLTVLVEIIHPETKVYIDYGKKKEFQIIGAYSTGDGLMKDWRYPELMVLGSVLGLPVTSIWSGETIKDLITLIRDRTIHNQEGYVLRFESGLRVKLKFENYIGLMVRDKLSPTYLMQRMIAGNLEKMLLMLPEEIHDIALNMLGEIMLRVATPGSTKDRWRRLYDLPHETSDNYFQSVCRQFVKNLLTN